MQENSQPVPIPSFKLPLIQVLQRNIPLPENYRFQHKKHIPGLFSSRNESYVERNKTQEIVEENNGMKSYNHILFEVLHNSTEVSPEKQGVQDSKRVLKPKKKVNPPKKVLGVKFVKEIHPREIYAYHVREPPCSVPKLRPMKVKHMEDESRKSSLDNITNLSRRYMRDSSTKQERSDKDYKTRRESGLLLSV